MLSSNTQNFTSNELILDQINQSSSSSLDRMKNLDKGQFKVYMGIGYFFVSSIVTLLLFL